MRLPVSKWGNSLAVRLPDNYVRQFGIISGDYLDATVSLGGEMHITPCRTAVDKSVMLKKITSLYKTLPQTTCVMKALREETRY